MFPDIWRLASVIPIFKKGDKSLSSNYKPVALLSCIGKSLLQTVYTIIEHQNSILDIPKRGIWQAVKAQMKYHKAQYFIRVCTVC